MRGRHDATTRGRPGGERMITDLSARKVGTRYVTHRYRTLPTYLPYQWAWPAGRSCPRARVPYTQLYSYHYSTRTTSFQFPPKVRSPIPATCLFLHMILGYFLLMVPSCVPVHAWLCGLVRVLVHGICWEFFKNIYRACRSMYPSCPYSHLSCSTSIPTSTYS